MTLPWSNAWRQQERIRFTMPSALAGALDALLG